MAELLLWFASYLSNRKQRIHVNGSISDEFTDNCGVPQGSCLHPLLFIIYASDMFSVIDNHLLDSRGYADDTQLYRSLNPNSADDQAQGFQEMDKCISDLHDWMTSSKLKMNDDKTECMLIGTRQQLTKLSINHISVGDTTVTTSQTVRNLGMLLDSNMSFHEQINKLSKSSFYFL